MLDRFSDVVVVLGPLSSLPKYEVLFACAGCDAAVSCWPGTGGGPILIGRGVSAVGVLAADDRLCMDISSSDSDPGPGERGMAAAAGGGGGGTGRDSGRGGPGGGRGTGLSPGTGGAACDRGRSAIVLASGLYDELSSIEPGTHCAVSS